MVSLGETLFDSVVLNVNLTMFHLRKISRSTSLLNIFTNSLMIEVKRIKATTSRDFFIEYYERLFVPKGIHFGKFLQFLNEPLPVTFRVNRTPNGSSSALEFLRNHPDAESRLGDTSWELTYGNVDELNSARCDDGELFDWRVWLAKQNKNGVIERQELVSMLPVLLLGIEADDRVLDVCAAPGSKTIQIWDALNKDRNRQSKGYLVANELDQKRVRVLVSRLKALGDNSNVAIVNHRAQTIPTSRRKFSKIICDVPCSGDGTLRKNHGLWAHWLPHYGLQLHSTQIQIAMRGLSLLQVGGRLMYSTCSLNPLENEAVVLAVLVKLKGHVKLIDCNSILQSHGVKSVEGFKEWDVVDDTGMIFQAFKDTRKSKPRSVRNRFRKTMFPTQDEDGRSQKQLKRCARILPHDNNTGGFFLACFELIEPLERRGQAQSSDAISSKQTKRKASSSLLKWCRDCEKRPRIVSMGN